MTLPDNRIPPAGTGGTSEDDLLARGIESNSIADLALVADGAMETLTGLLLSSPSTETARGLLAELEACRRSHHRADVLRRGPGVDRS